MKRALALAAGVYITAGLVGLLRERLGMVACGCADDCWCKRPGLSVFRWVFPRGHKSRWQGRPKPTVD